MIMLVQLTKVVPWAVRYAFAILIWNYGRDVLPSPILWMSAIEGILLIKNNPTIMTEIKALPIIPKNFIGLRV